MYVLLPAASSSAQPSPSLPSVSVAVRQLACIVRHFRSCLQHNRCGGNHSLFEGGELGVSHVAESFRDRIGRKIQIQRLRWPTIPTIQKRRRGGEACEPAYLVLVNSTSKLRDGLRLAKQTGLGVDKIR
jgi:hypothetical protein